MNTKFGEGKKFWEGRGFTESGECSATFEGGKVKRGG